MEEYGKKIKVLHLELSENMGGIESFLYNLYREIDRDKIQFDFVTRSDKPAMESELRELGAKIYHVSPYRKVVSYMRELDAILRKGYDVIHIHKNSAAIILPFLVARRHKGLKVFVHSHNTSPSQGRITRVLHFLNKPILWKLSDEHFACSKLAGEWLYGQDKDFRIIQNGIVTKKYLFDSHKRERERKELNLPDDSFVVGNIGRFAQQKNHIRLIDIFEQIYNKNNNSYLLLVGDGELKTKIENYCNESKKQMSAHVRFLGQRQDVAELLMAMDCFIMPSLYEGLPIAAIEAQASGLPVYLADTISKETEITDAVQWFSLDELDIDIANRVEMVPDLEGQRIIRNREVYDAGFDISNTSEYLLDKYSSQ